MNDQCPPSELLLRYLDDTLSAQERTRVEELLRVDRSAREVFRSLAEQAVVIADVQRMDQPDFSRSARLEEVGHSAPISNSATIWKSLVAVAVVSIFAITVAQFLPDRDREIKIVTINSSQGPIEWTGNGGRMTDELTAGSALPGGTIELMSAASWIEFEFRDHSTVTLSGLSAVTISEQRQKTLRLKHGSLSANVLQQPADRPLLVHTPSAELKVLGTQFNVDALADTTRLTVNEGRVRFTRLVDGKEVDVPARHEVRASMQDQDGLAVNEQVAAVSVWKSDLQADLVRGKWVSDLWMLGVKLKRSVASGEMNKANAIQAYKNAATLDNENGSVWADASPYGSLIAFSVSQSAVQSAARPVVLAANTNVRIKGHLHSRVALTFGISTRKRDGGFAGKYSVSVSDSELIKHGNPFEIEIPMSRFQQASKWGGSPIGQELSDWWCVADSVSAKLEITSVEVVE